MISRPDVVHLCYYYGYRGPVQKVVDNIAKNNNNHIILQISTNSNDENTEAKTIDKINFLKPKIIHLHFNSLFDVNNFRKINYEPNAIFQTVHGNCKSIYNGLIKQVVCIHDAARQLNNNATVIENTVDVCEGFYNPKFDSFVTGFRFVNEKIDAKMLEHLSKIDNTIDIFGASFLNNETYASLAQKIREYKNINLHFWDHFLERRIANHKAFIYIVAKNNSQLCYGLSLMEAVTIGVPVIALERTQTVKYIEHGKNGFIAQNYEDMVYYANELISNKNMFNKIKLGAAKHKFSINNTMPAKYNELYKKYL